MPDNLIPEMQPKLHAALGEMVNAVATGYGSIDLIMPGVHKANGLRILQERWGIENHQVVAFGDSGNDIEMLQHAGFGYAMANARRAGKSVAGYDAPHNNEEGVLHIIDKVLESRSAVRLIRSRVRRRAAPGLLAWATADRGRCRRFYRAENR
ncbi:Phosphatase YbjI [Raoultella terrigena]|uniref:Phosphatase YbjI n=1 Tax=Raoultella terrigena TaxID=577 RepID=A0A4U9DCA4_RAOTE|nr:Phosphatase YbjI [Raoultella terrigena]